jgi:cytochrome c
VTDSSNVYDVLIDLGEEKPAHYLDGLTVEMIDQGRQMALFGKTEKSKYISKYYVCTSCHNTVREDPDLRSVDQEARLNYASEHDIPYLQASTFWGMVNHESWYNDDYVLKYGDLVVKASNSLDESIQLCATVCSQGRRLEAWEMQAMKAYLWSLQLKINDLDLSSEEMTAINEALNQNSGKDEIKALIKSKYLSKSPATFGEVPKDKKNGFGLKGRPEKGEIIYRLGCKHCHRPRGESDVDFSDLKVTLKWLDKHKMDNTQLSLYEIIRHGTYADASHKEYMPHYTIEKMSDQQIEDLRAYIESKGR